MNKTAVFQSNLLSLETESMSFVCYTTESGIFSTKEGEFTKITSTVRKGRCCLSLQFTKRVVCNEYC
jgi:hypothetical protein